MAGIQNISGDRCVVIDCDLQDPPELIYDMNLKMDEGYDNRSIGSTLMNQTSSRAHTIITIEFK